MLPPAAVGVYSVTTRLMDIFVQLTGALIQTFKGAFYNSLAKQDSGELNKNFTEKVFRSFTWISILVAIFCATGSYILIPLLYGASFHNASTVLLIRAITIPLIAQGSLRLCCLVHNNNTKLSLQSTLTGLGTNVILNLLLIPKIGIFGAAIATALSQFIRIILSTFIFGYREIFLIQLKAFLPKRHTTKSLQELTRLSK